MHSSKTLAYDRDSQLIDLEILIAALPPDASLDELADYEWLDIATGNVRPKQVSAFGSAAFPISSGPRGSPCERRTLVGRATV